MGLRMGMRTSENCRSDLAPRLEGAVFKSIPALSFSMRFRVGKVYLAQTTTGSAARIGDI